MSIGGEQDIFDAALSGGDMPEVETPALPEAESASATPETSPAQPEAKEAQAEKPQDRENEAFVPSWRLREISEEKRRLERELAEAREWRAKVEKERQAAEKAENPPDVFVDPDGFVRQSVERAIDPVQQALQQSQAQTRQIVEHFSQQAAVREHGKEAVDAAYKALDQAISSGRMNREAVLGDLSKSMDPYGDILAWHKRFTFEQEIAGDPKAWMERQREALLQDPEFLAKAVAAARGQAAPVTTTRTIRPANSTPLPSLNATPRAGDEGDEPEDAADVFNAALNSRGRR